MQTHHTISYIEFAVRDLDAAKRFYSNAFGWTFNDYGSEYAGIKGGHGEVGGLRRTDELRTGGPLSFCTRETLNRVWPPCVQPVATFSASRTRSPGADDFISPIRAATSLRSGPMADARAGSAHVVSCTPRLVRPDGSRDR